MRKIINIPEVLIQNSDLPVDFVKNTLEAKREIDAKIYKKYQFGLISEEKELKKRLSEVKSGKVKLLSKKEVLKKCNNKGEK